MKEQHRKLFMEILDTDIEYFINPKMEKQTIYLGKHQMRFKKKAVDELSLKDGDILKVGLDKKENPKKHIYVVKASNGEDGFKVIIRNNSCMISFKGLYDKLQIDKPQNARYEVIDFFEKKAFKITLPPIV